MQGFGDLALSLHVPFPPSDGCQPDTLTKSRPSLHPSQARLEAEAEEQALDDIPPEFEDPVLGTLMRDPVKLPSGNVLDRATIMQHLLTDQRDPFSRVPMSEKDMEPMPELQAQIAAWLAEQRRARAAAAAAAEEKTDMEEG